MYSIISADRLSCVDEYGITHNTQVDSGVFFVALTNNSGHLKFIPIDVSTAGVMAPLLRSRTLPCIASSHAADVVRE